MTKRAELAVVVLASLALAACDRTRREEYEAERAERDYQAAIADYTAGRLDAAIEGFRKAIRVNPGNASARFQLAVLLEETKKDYLGAICAYRDFILLSPSGEKTGFARDRAANCERHLARELASKLNLTDNSEVLEELNLALAAKDKAESANAKLVAENEKLRKDLEVEKKVSAQRKALIDRMGAFGDDDDSPKRPTAVRTAADSENAAPRSVNVADVQDDGRGELRLNPEALALNDSEEEAERKGSQLLPAQTEDSRANVRLSDLGKVREEQDADRMAAVRPKTYTVEPGDTLYSIARRFYGRKSAWTQIREANKATVSTDGKVRAGVELVLP